MVYVGKCDLWKYQNKTLIYVYQIKTKTSWNFSLQKENDCKVQLHFAKYCTCCYWGIPYITFSTEQISYMPFYNVENVYYKIQLGP